MKPSDRTNVVEISPLGNVRRSYAVFNEAFGAFYQWLESFHSIGKYYEPNTVRGECYDVFPPGVPQSDQYCVFLAGFESKESSRYGVDSYIYGVVAYNSEYFLKLMEQQNIQTPNPEVALNI